MAKPDKQNTRKAALEAITKDESTKPEAGEPAAQPAAFVQRGEAVPAVNRLSVALKADGSIDWDSMRPKSREKFLGTIKADSQLSKLLGQNAATEEAFQFKASDARAALNMLTQANQFAVGFVFKKKGLAIDPDILGQAFAYPAETEKDLTERGARLLNRYSSDWMRKHADLVMFFAVYFDCVKTQAITAAMLQMQRNERKQPQPAAKPNGHGVEATRIDPADLRAE